MPKKQKLSVEHNEEDWETVWNQLCENYKLNGNDEKDGVVSECWFKWRDVITTKLTL